MSAALMRILGLATAALLLASCSGPLFSKVEIKAKPSVYAALGSAKANVSSYLTTAKVNDLLKGATGLKVYDYQDTTTTQTYLIQYPLTSVQLDFGQYLKDINLDTTLSQTLAPMSFSIPTVNQANTSAASFDLNATLRSSMNGGFGTVTSPFVETGLASTTATLPDASITVGSFTSATFSAGSLNLALSMTGASAGLALTATVSIVDSSTGTTITSTATPVDIKAGGTAVLPLLNKTLPSSFKVRFSATTSGGVLGQSDTVNVTPSLSSDVAVSAVSGVSFTTNVTVPTVTVPMSAATTFVKAVVGAGSLAIDLGTLPAGWTNITRSTNLSISQSNGLAISQNNVTTQTVTVPLAGQTISASDVTINASTTIKALGASFTGLSATPTAISFGSTFAVTQFTSVVVNPGTSFTPTKTFSPPTSQQMKDWVNYVDFNSVGIQISFTNNLPAGNDMTINANSTAFGVTGTAQTLPSGGAAGTTTTVSFTNGSLATPYHFIPANWPNLDFAVTLAPQAYNTATGELTLYNIVPGSTLSFSGTVTLVDDWAQANIKPPAGGYAGHFPDTGTTDLSMLADYLGAGLTFGPIKSYLYLSGLPPASVSGLTGLVQATYTDAGVAKTFDVFGTTGAPATLTMLTSGPTFTTTVAGGDTIDAVNHPLDMTTVSAALGDLSVPLNAKPKDLALTYNLNMTGLLITKSQAVVGGVPQKLQADLVLLLPV